MTRQEIALKNTEARAEKTRKKVLIAVTSLFAKENFTKKNGSWSYAKIAEYCGVHAEVVSKYVKEFERQNIV